MTEGPVVKRTVWGNIQDAVNITRVRKAIKLGFEMSSALQPVLDKPSWWNAGRAAIGVAKVFLDDVEVWPDVFFDDEREWRMPYSREFAPLITPILSKFPVELVKSNEPSMVIKLVDAEGIKFGYVHNTKLNTSDSVYVDAGRIEDGKAFIKRQLWSGFNQSSLVMRNNRKTSAYGNEPRIVFEVDDAFNPLPSARASEYATYLKRCLDAGVPRSVMLYGPPGTGKSTMARTLVEELKFRSFRIRVEDVGYTENSVIFEAISIFSPDVIILDDFDRCHNQAQLLETLEFFKRHVKLVIATVNNRGSLDEAILRPGRFDELIYVDHMEEPVIRHMLGEYQDAYETIKEWPIAFIEEYVIRRRFMSKAETETSLQELISRVARLRKYRESHCDDDDVEGKFLEKVIQGERRGRRSRGPYRKGFTARVNPPGQISSSIRGFMKALDEGGSVVAPKTLKWSAIKSMLRVYRHRRTRKGPNHTRGAKKSR
jgi:hypothetical protein